MGPWHYGGYGVGVLEQLQLKPKQVASECCSVKPNYHIFHTIFFHNLAGPLTYNQVRLVYQNIWSELT